MTNPNSRSWLAPGIAGIAALAAVAAAAISALNYRHQLELGAQSHASISGDHGICRSVQRSGAALEGTATLINGERLWILINSPKAGSYYVSSQGPVTVSNGKWDDVVSDIGGPDDVDQEFRILAVVANFDASNSLTRQLQTSAKGGGANPFVGLPPGSRLADNLCLKRRD